VAGIAFAAWPYEVDLIDQSVVEPGEAESLAKELGRGAKGQAFLSHSRGSFDG